MKQFISKNSFLKSVMMISIAAMLFCTNAFAGRDSYKIYLNDKLLTNQAASNDMNVASLDLSSAQSSDMLVVYYSHCHGEVAKDRSIIMKDANGNVVKEWKFGDASSAASSMSIPVKEIIALQKKNTHLQLYYAAAKLIPNGQFLVTI
jgi:hypothetical protein